MAGNLFVAWSRSNEDIDGHTRGKVHIQRSYHDDGDKELTLCGIPITAWWEMDVWDIDHLESWVGCKRCERVMSAAKRNTPRAETLRKEQP